MEVLISKGGTYVRFLPERLRDHQKKGKEKERTKKSWIFVFENSIG